MGFFSSFKSAGTFKKGFQYAISGDLENALTALKDAENQAGDGKARYEIQSTYHYVQAVYLLKVGAKEKASDAYLDHINAAENFERECAKTPGLGTQVRYDTHKKSIGQLAIVYHDENEELGELFFKKKKPKTDVDNLLLLEDSGCYSPQDCCGNGKRRRITVIEAELDNLPFEDDPERVLKYPQLKKPFGFMNDLWEIFISEIQPGDELWEFSTPDELWENLAGKSGIMLVRDDEVIAKFITIKN